MSRRCDINTSKGVLSGHKVSHSNRKSKRKYLPNLQPVSLMSEALGHSVSLRLTPNTIKTIEHNDGIDSYLLKTSSRKITEGALALKKRIQKALAKKEAKAAA